ncbi:hypothetical protein [Methylobacter sp. S3L5C]|nr:hypothetical protein [Methylobacter sp. S3L5C]UOA07311.1 hypothetical protein KKZ03_13565 [Methylobacter sp. S3L5C]
MTKGQSLGQHGLLIKNLGILHPSEELAKPVKASGISSQNSQKRKTTGSK